MSNRLVKYWLPPIAWAGLIFVFSSFPTAKTFEIYWQDFVIKKTAHVVEYGILAALLYRALRESGMEKGKAGVWAILAAVFYGATDEFHQSFVPGREPRARDLVFDTIGSVLVIYGIWRLLPKAPRRLKIWAAKLELL